MTQEPGPGDFLKWLRAYPKLNDPIEKRIWWAVFKHYWAWPLLIVLASEAIWHLLFKLMGW